MLVNLKWNFIDALVVHSDVTSSASMQVVSEIVQQCMEAISNITQLVSVFTGDANRAEWLITMFWIESLQPVAGGVN